MNNSFLPYVLYIPPISSIVITSGSTNHEAPPRAVFSSLLFRRPPQHPVPQRPQLGIFPNAKDHVVQPSEDPEPVHPCMSYS